MTLIQRFKVLKILCLLILSVSQRIYSGMKNGISTRIEIREIIRYNSFFTNNMVALKPLKIITQTSYFQQTKK